jgi:hypothetical protein
VTETRPAARWRRPVAFAFVVAAMLLATSAPAAHAADDLRWATDTTYRVDPGDGVVRVRLDIRITNQKPNAVRRTATQILTTRYFYDKLFLSLQREARSVRATSNGSTLRVSIANKARHRALTVRIPNLYYRQSRSIRLEYELPGSKPRSAGDIRVGQAYTTFTTWAWGDPGLSTVRVVMPKGFTNHGYGKPFKASTEDGRVVLSSGKISDPGDWYSVISADRPSALTNVQVGTDDAPIVVHAWPEDSAWRDQVSKVLDDGVPVLQELIGLDWPVSGELTVTEVHTPPLEGYAGTYTFLSDAIRISEELDAQTILHEASHAWFDYAFINERWIYEGLAEEYTARALEKAGIEGPAAPKRVTPTDKIAFRLADWPGPGRLDDDDTAAREDFGYAASWLVMREVVRQAGEDGMRDVFDALAVRAVPYPGEDPTEKAADPADWQYFLDLVQELTDSEDADELFRTWVAPDSAFATLDARAKARDAFHALEASAGEWTAPQVVRLRMWTWSFGSASEGIAAAQEVVADRDALAAISARLGTAIPAAFEAQFEAARTTPMLERLEVDVERHTEVAETLLATRDQLAVPRSPIAELGLVGEVATAGFDAGLAAFSANDLDGALAGSAASVAMLAGAEEVGRGRAIAIAVAVIGLLLLLLLAAWLLRRRRRRRSIALDAGPGPSIALAGGPGASTTLPGTPDSADAGAGSASAATPPEPGAVSD